jgi:hypothetical protein
VRIKTFCFIGFRKLLKNFFKKLHIPLNFYVILTFKAYRLLVFKKKRKARSEAWISQQPPMHLILEKAEERGFNKT